MTRDRRAAPPWWPTAVAALALFALCAWMFHPGWLSFDSAYQWYQVRTGNWDNVHPVIMTLLWSLADRVWPGPGGYFLLQLLLYWSGLAFLVTALFEHTCSRVGALVLLGLFPPVFALVPHLWKDIGMLVALIWTVALLAHDLRAPSRGLRVGALAALTVACAFRHNALPLALPLLWYLAGREPRLAGTPRRIVATTVLLLAVTVVSALPNRLPGVEQRQVWPVTALWDIAAVSIATRTMLLPAEVIDPTLTIDELEQHFTPYSNVPIFGTAKIADSVSAPMPAFQRAAIDRAWLRLWVDHPLEYARHRLRLAGLLAGLDRPGRPTGLVVQPGVVPLGDNPQVASDAPVAARLWTGAIEWLSGTVLFSLPPYLVAIAVLALAPLRVHHPLLRPVALSALLYLLPLPFVSPSAEWRYLVWPVFTAPLLAMLCAASRDAGGKTAPISSDLRR